MHPRPSFLGIGAGHAGTTWLSAVLAAHPGVFVTSPKELHYWTDLVRTQEFAWYLAHFKGSEDFAVRGEITPAYSWLPEKVVRWVGKLLPDLRLVFLIRHPVERIWSHHIRHYYRHRVDPGEELPLRRHIRRYERLSTVWLTDYERTIDAWTSVYGEEALFVALYDEVKTDPAGLVRRVLRHIGADDTWEPPQDLLGATVNPKPRSAIELPAYSRWYLAQRWLEPTRRLNDRLGGRLSHWVDDMASLKVEEPWWPARWALDRALIAGPEHLAGRVKYEHRIRDIIARCEVFHRLEIAAPH